MIPNDLIQWLLGVGFGLIAGWLLTWTIYAHKMRKLQVNILDYKDDTWGEMFGWTNRELKNLESSKEFSPQAKIIYHNVLLKFQEKIKEEKLKLLRIGRKK